MSVKKEYKTVVREVSEVIKSTMYCDVCNKEIPKGAEYWHIHMHDYNDKYREGESFDTCSEACTMSKFAEYVNRSCGNGNDGKYINVEKDYER